MKIENVKFRNIYGNIILTMQLGFYKNLTNDCLYKIHEKNTEIKLFVCHNARQTEDFLEITITGKKEKYQIGLYQLSRVDNYEITIKKSKNNQWVKIIPSHNQQIVDFTLKIKNAVEHLRSN